MPTEPFLFKELVVGQGTKVYRTNHLGGNTSGTSGQEATVNGGPELSASLQTFIPSFNKQPLSWGATLGASKLNIEFKRLGVTELMGRKLT